MFRGRYWAVSKIAEGALASDLTSPMFLCEFIGTRGSQKRGVFVFALIYLSILIGLMRKWQRRYI